MNKWDERFLGLAEHIAGWSKDPSTQCGAVIVRGKQIVSMGFNGFPQGVSDTKDRLNNREEKYRMVIHAEVNAILFAKEDLSDCTIYVWPCPPCSQCATKIIQSNIKRVVAKAPTTDMFVRWEDDFMVAEMMYQECGLSVEVHS